MPPPERPSPTPQPASYRYHAIAIVLAAVVTFMLAELLDIEDCKCALDHWAESPEAMAALANWRPDGVLCDFETMDYSTGSWPPARPDADFPAAPRTCGSLRGSAADNPGYGIQCLFDQNFWNKRPLKIEGGARHWPAYEKWTKEYLRSLNSTAAHSKLTWIATDDYWASYHFNANRTRTKMDVGDFLCDRSCLAEEIEPEPERHDPPGQMAFENAPYLFDRDEWRAEGSPLSALTKDIVIPPVIAAHFDKEWHERWSIYLLLSAVGSGINFHQHTNAFNALLAGKKLWFVAPPNLTIPDYKLGPVRWYRKLVPPDPEASQEEFQGLRDKGLQMCIQNAGDLLYVPQHYWHATISLAEGVAISGQFVRRTNAMLGKATKLAQEKKYAEAASAYSKVLDHADELETEVLAATSLNLVIVRLQGGWLETARTEAAKTRVRINRLSATAFVKLNAKFKQAEEEIKEATRQRVLTHLWHEAERKQTLDKEVTTEAVERLEEKAKNMSLSAGKRAEAKGAAERGREELAAAETTPVTSLIGGTAEEEALNKCESQPGGKCSKEWPLAAEVLFRNRTWGMEKDIEVSDAIIKSQDETIKRLTEEAAKKKVDIQKMHENNARIIKEREEKEKAEKIERARKEAKAAKAKG